MSERAHGTEHEAPGEWRKLAFLAAVSGVLGLLSLVADQFGDIGRIWALILIAGRGCGFAHQLRGIIGVVLMNSCATDCDVPRTP